jgi:hypothetical protein
MLRFWYIEVALHSLQLPTFWDIIGDTTPVNEKCVLVPLHADYSNLRNTASGQNALIGKYNTSNNNFLFKLLSQKFMACGTFYNIL